MAQFDVHRNRGASRESTPYVVIVQSSFFDSYRRRVVIPLVEKTRVAKIENERLNPTFRVESVTVILHPLDIVSAPRNVLGKRVASLAEESDRIIAALDELLTRS